MIEAPLQLSNALADVTPAECALAVAIPMSREEFLHDLEDQQNRDYIPANYSKREQWAQYESQARALNDHCRALTEMGVTVCRSASLDDLHDLLASPRHKVVTLIAHSRWSGVTAEDLPNVQRLLQVLRGADSAVSPVLAALNRALEGQVAGLLRPGDAPADHAHTVLLRQTVALRLDELVQVAHAFYQRSAYDSAAWPGSERNEGSSFWASLSHAVRELLGRRPEQVQPPGTLPLQLFTRAILEYQLGPCLLHPCKSVELRSGLHTAADFLGCVPETFEGVLDLCICSSALHCVALSRPNRRYLALMLRSQASPRYQLLIHRLVMEELRDKAQPYLVAQEWVRRNIRKELSDDLDNA